MGVSENGGYPKFMAVLYIRENNDLPWIWGYWGTRGGPRKRWPQNSGGSTQNWKNMYLF